MNRKAELLGEIVDNARDKAPTGWTCIELTYTMIGESFELEVGIDTLEGPYMAIGGPIGFPSAVQQLRDLMYIPGHGTWFTLHLRIDIAGFETRFGYERPVDESLLGIDLEQDLQIYPRDIVPQWMLEEIAESHRLASESNEPADDLQGGIDNLAVLDYSDVFGSVLTRDQAKARAFGFTPTEDGLRYISLVREPRTAEVPVVTYSEVDVDGFELRKVEVFDDGTTGIAGMGAHTARTVLDRNPIPLVVEPSQRAGWIATEISPSAFQVEWLAAGGW
ncbi:hypothetical protein KHQ06_06535 [Nocardia tengchongensis]|uniref:DUF6881 domain-containing protein n=1 Tax=Nocardia tengchongensis TaxID=2055889 RepID=A0ABX8CRY6_9NOCA|nr:hypothetical protein [Nocardia tengchongensis]QVI22671.1 hypothetical protein KHQ06_06535 [Nocardia tengchongensis]